MGLECSDDNILIEIVVLDGNGWSGESGWKVISSDIVFKPHLNWFVS